jgi:N-acetylneuraminic acid mutarotase
VSEWTGKEVVLWGGGTSNEAFDDGAAYDPATDKWRPLPKSPIAGRFSHATWTDKEVLFWGGEDWSQVFADGAAYDPAANTWRSLPEGPLSARIVDAQVWTGQEMVVWSGTPGTFNNYFADGAAYVPATNTWKPIARWSGRFGSIALWTGKEMLVWGGIVPTGTAGGQTAIKSVADGRRFVP